MLFKEFNIRTLTIPTVWAWMKQLGFKYEVRKKSYYVDNHDSQENVLYRNKFIDRYFDYELRCYRWYSIPKTKKNEMVQNGDLLDELGYEYEKDGINMVEYHVDDHVSFQETCSSLPYGGNLSIRKDPNLKPLMINGQDEVIFRQNTFTGSSWTLPDGTKQLLPKDDGQGLMLSSFCSRELGYGYSVPPDILKIVNEKRKSEKYDDENAAIIKNGSANKPPLTISPFARELEYGNNHEGYWMYENMILQLEDCVDVLKVTHPEFEFLFLFDHSNGHDRLQPNGLNRNKISVRFGGKQSVMRETLLTHDLFGPFHTKNMKHQPGTTQSM